MPRVKATSRSLLRIGDEEIMFDPGKILLSEAVAAEKAAGLSWPQVVLGLDQGVARAVQAVVWVMRKRSNPKLRFGEIEFSWEEYTAEDPDYLPDHWILADEDDLFAIVIPDDDEPLQDEAPDDDEPEQPEAPKADTPEQED